MTTFEIRVTETGGRQAAKSVEELDKAFADLDERIGAFEETLGDANEEIEEIEPAADKGGKGLINFAAVTYLAEKAVQVLSAGVQFLRDRVANIAEGAQMVELARQFGATGEQAEMATQAAIAMSNTIGGSVEENLRRAAKTLGGYAGELGEVIPEMKELTQEQLRAGAGVELLFNKFAAGIGTSTSLVGIIGEINTMWDMNRLKVSMVISQNEQLVAAFAEIRRAVSEVFETTKTSMIDGIVSRAVLFTVDALKFLGLAYFRLKGVLLSAQATTTAVWEGIFNASKIGVGAVVDVLDWFLDKVNAAIQKFADSGFGKFIADTLGVDLAKKIENPLRGVSKELERMAIGAGEASADFIDSMAQNRVAAGQFLDKFNQVRARIAEGMEAGVEAPDAEGVGASGAGTPAVEAAGTAGEQAARAFVDRYGQVIEAAKPDFAAVFGALDGIGDAMIDAFGDSSDEGAKKFKGAMAVVKATIATVNAVQSASTAIAAAQQGTLAASSAASGATAAAAWAPAAASASIATFGSASGAGAGAAVGAIAAIVSALLGVFAAVRGFAAADRGFNVPRAVQRLMPGNESMIVALRPTETVLNEQQTRAVTDSINNGGNMRLTVPVMLDGEQITRSVLDVGRDMLREAIQYDIDSGRIDLANAWGRA